MWLVVLASCTTTDVQLAKDDAAAPTRERLGLTSADEAAILDFLNDCDTTLDVLDNVVGLDSDAADNLIEHRDGPDATCGTGDDVPFLTLDDVEAVPQVGDRTILDILSYIQGSADGTGTWEGVEFTEHEQAVVLEIANEASLEELDGAVGLPSDAAGNIVDARPVGSMGALAEVPQVGESALEKLKAYVATWEP